MHPGYKGNDVVICADGSHCMTSRWVTSNHATKRCRGPDHGAADAWCSASWGGCLEGSSLLGKVTASSTNQKRIMVQNAK